VRRAIGLGRAVLWKAVLYTKERVVFDRRMRGPTGVLPY